MKVLVPRTVFYVGPYKPSFKEQQDGICLLELNMFSSNFLNYIFKGNNEIKISGQLLGLEVCTEQASIRKGLTVWEKGFSTA